MNMLCSNRPHGGIPRSHERGHIEAAIGLESVSRSQLGIPRSHERGHIEANCCSIAATCSVKIPRSHERGHIEAYMARSRCLACAARDSALT